MSTVQMNPEHSYFLHRDNDSKSLLNNGVIEACWYTPVDCDDDAFKDFTCIYNLRGDIKTNEVKLDILLAVSSVFVVFLGEKLTSHITKKFMSSKTPLILVEMTSIGKEKKMGSMKMIFGKNKTVKEVAKDVCRSLDMESTEYTPLSLEDHAIKAKSFGIFVDEDYSSCRTGKIQAEKVIHIFDRYSIDNVKRNVTPLQEDLLRQLAENEKDQFRQKRRQDNVDPSEYCREIKEENRKIRREQRLVGPSEALFSFLESMIELSEDSMIYFLDYAQFYFNQNLKKYLSELTKRHIACRKYLDDKKEEMGKLQRNSSNSSKDMARKKILQEEIDLAVKHAKSISELFDTASFGIEDIFREIAQIYESFEDTENVPDIIEELPKLMADLLLRGYSLEIMDGKLSHVPLLWLEKVLNCLEKSLKEIVHDDDPLSESREPRIFVSSILGMQSTGKSTFLNTMYGSKFLISSSQCTRGINIRLLPVKKECRNKINCDFYIIMDSEGLRFSELGDSYNRRNNEIATLVSCLANTTMINFWGQNFSKDMADVILKAVFAYMQMTEVNIKPSFHLVFAGTQDVTAKDKNQFGLNNVIDALNQKVFELTKSQGQHDLFLYFESIFPMVKELYRDLVFPQFFPVIWHGSMSPPASMYGEMVNKLKRAFINALSKGNGSKHVQPISEFLNRLKEVWRAIKMENFTFGFRNTQALQDYGKLQICYEKRLKKLRELFYQEAWNVEASVMTELFMDKNKQNLDLVIKIYEKKISAEYMPKLEAEKEKVKKYLMDKITKLSNPDNGIMYFCTFENHLSKTVAQLLEREKSCAITNIKVTLKADVCVKEKQNIFIRQFLVKAREVAIEMKYNQSAKSNGVYDATISQTLINEKFESLFSGFLLQAQIDDRETFGDTDNIHMLLFDECLPYLINKIKTLKIPTKVAIDEEIAKSKFGKEPIIDVRKSDILIGATIWNSEAFVEFATETLLSLEGYVEQSLLYPRVDVYVTTNVSYSRILANIIDHIFEKMNREKISNEWCFQRTYRMKILVSYYGYAIKELAEIKLKKFRRYSLERILTKEKKNLRKEFEDDCNNANMDIRTVKTYYKDTLFPFIVRRMKLTLGNEIYNDWIGNEVFSSKNMIMFHVQKELLDAEVKDVINFSKNFNFFVTKWIWERVVDYLKNGTVKTIIEKRFAKERCKKLLLKPNMKEWMQVHGTQ